MPEKVGSIEAEAKLRTDYFKQGFESLIKDIKEGEKSLEDLGKTLDDVEERWNALIKPINDVASSIRSVTAIAGGITGFFGLAWREAQRAAEAQNALASALKSTGASWEKWGKPLDGMIKKMALATKYTRDDITEGLTRMIAQTGNVEASLGLMTAAMGHAELSGYGLRNSVRTINQVMEGNVGVLRNWWGEFRDVDALMEKFGSRAKVIEYALGKLRSIKPPAPEAWQLFNAQMKELQITVGRIIGTVYGPLLRLATGVTAGLEKMADNGFGRIILQVGAFVGVAITMLGSITLLITKVWALTAALGAATVKILLAAGAQKVFAATAEDAAANTTKFAAAVTAARKAGLAWLGWIGLAIGALEALAYLNREMLNSQQDVNLSMDESRELLAASAGQMGRMFTILNLLHKAWGKLAGSVDENLDFLKAYEDAVARASNIMKEQINSLTAYQQALEKQRKAQEEVRKTIVTGGIDVAKFAEAMRTLDDANREVADGWKELLYFLKTGTKETTEFQKASDALTKAQELESRIIDRYGRGSREATSATNARRRAQQALNKLVVEGSAELKFALGATTKYAKAVIEEKTALAAVADLQKANKEGTLEYISAQQTASEATRNRTQMEAELNAQMGLAAGTATEYGKAAIDLALANELVIEVQNSATASAEELAYAEDAAARALERFIDLAEAAGDLDTARMFEGVEKALEEFKKERGLGDLFNAEGVAELYANVEQIVGELQIMRSQGIDTAEDFDKAIADIAANFEFLAQSGELSREELALVALHLQDITRGLLKEKGGWESVLLDFAGDARDSSKKAANMMIDNIGTFEDAAIKQMQGGRVEMKKIFQGIAADWLKFFIDEALKAMVIQFLPGVAKFLKFIGPHPEMDRMVMQTGADWAKYFTEGALAGLSDFSAAVAMPGLGEMPTTPSPVVNVPESQVVVHEATPNTWIEIYDNKLEPRRKQVAALTTEEG